MLKAEYLLPLTILFLVIAVGTLGFRAGIRRGYGPFGLGVVASAFLVTGKFAVESGPMMYIGISLLVAASIWNTWPRKERSRSKCPACTFATQSIPENKSDNIDRKEAKI